MSRHSIPVKERTRDRLLAFSNRNLLEQRTYDEAVNELLDYVEFPMADELKPEIWTIGKRRN